MSTIVAVIVGLVLCVEGGRALKVSIPLGGFAVAWCVLAAAGVPAGPALLLSLLFGVLFLLFAAVFSATALFLAGSCAGGAVGARLLVLTEPGPGHDAIGLLGLLLVAIPALGCGLLAIQNRSTFLQLVTSLAGAGLVVAAVGRTGPDTLDHLWRPVTTADAGVLALAWLLLAAAGFWVQRRREHETRRPPQS